MLDDRKRKLEYFSIKTNDILLKKIDFEYATNTVEEIYISDKKFFLTKVNFYDKNYTKIYDYKFDYNNPNYLPSKWSKAKDENGYFNNVTTNTTLLPFDSRFTGTIALANRETNPITIGYGSLSKITYPTGGFTTFTYEVPVKGYKEGVDTNFLNVYHRAIDRNDENLYEHLLNTKSLNEDGTKNSPTFLKDEKIEASISIVAEGGFTQGTYARIYAISESKQYKVYEFHFPQTPDNNAQQSFNEIVNLVIPKTGDDYIFKLVLTPHNTVRNGNRIDVRARLNIKSSIPIPQYYPSLRIKEIITYSDSATRTPNIKRYYYNSLDQIGKENSVLMSSFNHVNKTTNDSNCVREPIVYLNLSTSALNNTFVDDSRKIIYPIVTISYGGNNFKQGGKELHFRVNPGPANDLYFQAHENNGVTLNVEPPYAAVLSYDNGKLLKEKTISYDSVTRKFKTLKQIDYIHSAPETTHRMNNIKASNVQNISNDIRKYNFSFYELISKKNPITTIITTEYAEDSNVPIITTESYTYGKYVDRSSETEITDSKGKKKKVKYFYPDDVLNAYTLGFDRLSTSEFNDIYPLRRDFLHRINLIQQESYQIDGSTETLLSATRTLYHNQASGFPLPYVVETLKGEYNATNNDTLTPRIIYHDYDNKGNPIEVSKKDGTHIVYIWGYNQTQPIVKIENASYENLTTAQNTAINNAKLASNNDTDEATEAILRTKLNILRGAFPDAQVTTYTYDPLIGVTSITDPRGDTVYYEYDDFNRLKHVKDKDGHILSENEYNYKN